MGVRDDYAIWSRAVRVYCARGAGAPELLDLQAALIAVRQYDAEDLPEPTSAPEPLRLAIDNDN